MKFCQPTLCLPHFLFPISMSLPVLPVFDRTPCLPTHDLVDLNGREIVGVQIMFSLCGSVLLQTRCVPIVFLFSHGRYVTAAYRIRSLFLFNYACCRFAISLMMSLARQARGEVAGETEIAQGQMGNHTMRLLSHRLSATV